MNRKTFPSRIPIGLLLGGMAAVLSLVPTFAVFRSQLEPVQAHYLKTYLRLSVVPHRQTAKPQKFLLLVRANGTSAPPSACQVTTKLLLPSPTGNLSSELVETALRCSLETPPADMKAWLRGAVYSGQSCFDLIQSSLTVWAVFAVCCVLIGSMCDVWRKRRARQGVQLRGPELVSRWQFNRRVKGDGFPIVLENSRNLFELMRGQVGKVLRIRRKDENKNIICMSDPGGGKTSILMQILDEVERRG
jgi:hypothetical protein